MKRYLFCLILFTGIFLFPDSSQAQQRYWVFFRDKDNVEFDPYSYFDARTIQKRLSRGTSLVEYTDLPVRQDYIEGLEKLSVRLHTVSRWFNAVSISPGRYTPEQILQLSYVEKIVPIQMKSVPTKKPFEPVISPSIETLRKKQLESMGESFFQKKGIDGTGVRIAVFDGGFPGVDTSPMFEHLRNGKRIIATWDFVKNKENVYDFSSHGTAVLTCIAGQLGDKKFGLATGAEFLLARTEIRREVFSEEENWLAAMEWADKNGADIINSSLGYTHHRYKQEQMDGRSTLVSRAATMAANKGMLVVNAAGNDGSGFWKVVGAPADADSILSVGGINPGSGYKIDFSSYGPTFDGRMKPNVSAFGKAATSNAKKIRNNSGTSFSAPLVAGFAACVMQMNPNWSNMKTYDEIQKSGHLHPYFDYAHGFGVPQAAYFTGDKKEVLPAFVFAEENDSVKIIFNRFSESEVPDPTISKVENEIKQDSGVFSTNHTNGTNIMDRYTLDDNYLYFHISGKDEHHVLKRYAVVRIDKNHTSFDIPKEEVEGAILRVFYRGYFSEYIH